MSFRKWIGGSACVVALSIVSLAATAKPSDEAVQRIGDVGSPMEGEAIRDELLDFVDALHETATTFGHRRSERLSERTRRLLVETSPEEFAALSRHGNVQFPDMRDMTRELRALADYGQASRGNGAGNEAPPSSAIAGAHNGGKQPFALGGSSPESFAPFPETPPELADCAGIAHDSSSVFVVQTAFFVAEGVWNAVNRACNQDVLGENTSLVCIAADELLEVAKALYATATFCWNESTGVLVTGIDSKVNHLHGDLDQTREDVITNDDANTSTIVANANTNTSTIVANDNTNTSTIVANDNTNKSTIIANDNTNTSTIIANDNTNTSTITNNANTNTASIIANDNTNTATIIAELRAEMRALNCEVMRLVTTPEGQRSSSLLQCQGQPGFPYQHHP